MNIPPSEAKALSLREYEGILWNWNDAQKGEDDLAAPDGEEVDRAIAIINADKRLTGPKPELVN